MSGGSLSQSIRFILNGALREVTDLPATTTLLQYLRAQERLTGTKEGCAEGDCGACTVMAGRPDAAGGVEYRSLNACIAFLPALDGADIVTVEYLKTLSGGALHPVQRAMVDCHGSQCGFCTPGFVMALTALGQHRQNPSEDEIQDAISGNLCRCTGYRPILDAARQALALPQPPLPARHAEMLAELRRDKMLRYEAAGSLFLAPRSVPEMAAALAEYPDATLLAGGTDVGLWVTKMHKDLPVIIYTGHIAGLRAVTEAADRIEIGAAATYTEAFAALAKLGGGMEDFLRRLGSAHIRNAGTVGGNIANGSPIGDGMPPLIALGARIVLRAAAGAREIALEDYFIEYKKQDRRAGEFLEKIIVPKPGRDVLFAAYKVSKRFDQDISAVCGAFALTLKDGKVAQARLAYGGMAGIPKRATAAEKALLGRVWGKDAARAAMAAVAEDFQPMSDMRASDAYRRTVAANLIERFLIETTEPATLTQVYRHGA
jgi:xanthine dehydrogenase small subunit